MRRIKKLDLSEEFKKNENYYLKLLTMACDKDDILMFGAIGMEMQKRGIAPAEYSGIFTKMYGREAFGKFVLSGLDKAFERVLKGVKDFE